MALVSVAELADLIKNANVVVCDVRFYLADHEQAHREYADGHIPGAVFVDLHHDLAGAADGENGGGRHPLPSVDSFTSYLGSIGIDSGTYVIAYDSAGGSTASRLWWMLRSIEHGRVAVLDGGFPAWVAAEHHVTTETVECEPAEYPSVAGWTGILDSDGVVEGTAFSLTTLIDSRAPDRFRGDLEPVDARAGHIPGATNKFHADNLGPDGLHLPVAELAQRFAGVGSSPIVYCGSGVTACHNLLVMSMIGLTSARLYPGSWSDWSSQPDRPIATGD
jgi:thiosulfate/3-mercaptopyruvate sulfurtransferase